MSCQNNLKQLGLAAHNYHSAYEQLPPGYHGPSPNIHYPNTGHLDTPAPGTPDTPRWHGVLVYLLPYIEQDNIYKQLTTVPGGTNMGNWWSYNPDWTLAHSRIKILLCPSDPVEPGGITVGSAAMTHSYDSGPPAGAEGAVLYYFPGETTLGKTNYTGVAGTGWADGSIAAPSSLNANYKPYTGAFTNRSKVKIQAMPDGSSNTLLFGEGLGGSYPGARDFQWTWMGVGAMATYRGLCNGPAGSATGVLWAGFSSAHTGVVQFCFGDGSVRGIRHGSSAARSAATGASGSTPSNDWWAFQALAGIGDEDLRGSALLN
jgi:hypothetical protein